MANGSTPLATRPVRIGVVGDYHEANETHRATTAALHHAAHDLDARVDVTWMGTAGLERHGVDVLNRVDGLFVAPGSPYESMRGALGAIEFARRHAVPLLGTCAGFQHVVIEYARNAAGIVDAAHQETDPDAPCLVVSALTCSLVGQTFEVDLVPGTRTAGAYASTPITERYYCNFGLNRDYLEPLTAAGLVTAGVDAHGETRVIEVLGLPFFVATLFVPQASSAPEAPHPLVRAFLGAAKERQDSDP